MWLIPYKVLHGLVPQYLGPLNRVADLPGRRSISSFYWLQPYGGAVGQAVNCCQPSLPGGRPTNLEWSTGWSDIRWIVDHIPLATENSFLPARRYASAGYLKSFPGYLLDIN